MLFPLLLAVFATFGCASQPERDNPVDPGSPGFRDDAVLRISVRNDLGQPLPGASIQRTDSTLAAVTDASGQAQLETPPGIHTFRTSADAYVPRLDTLQLRIQEELDTSLVLNGRPAFGSIQVTTGMSAVASDESRHRYSYTVRTTLSDPDGLLDPLTVDLREEGRPTVYEMEQQEESTAFHLERDLGYFIDSLRTRIGLPLILTSHDGQDSSSATASISSLFYYRYLYEHLETDEITDVNEPVFGWSNPSNAVGFVADTYRFELFTVDQTSEPQVDTTFSFQDTDVDSFFYAHPESLPLPGSIYQWRLTLYDPFGNWVRSKKTAVITPVRTDGGGGGEVLP